jgi:hypothetical protein
MAFLDFDGTVRVVRAHRVIRVCGRQTWAFWTHSLALAIALVTGLVMMILSSFDNQNFGLWSGIFALGLGGFIPNPKLKDVAGAESANIVEAGSV